MQRRASFLVQDENRIPIPMFAVMSFGRRREKSDQKIEDKSRRVLEGR